MILHSRGASYPIVVFYLVGLTYGHPGDDIRKVFKDYNKALRPNFDDGVPTIIQSNIYIESFGNIEEANMEYKVYGYFRQRWNDSRLVGRVNQTLWLKGKDIDNIWIPDPYCYNARESNLKVPDEEKYSSVRIHNNGNIEMSIG